MNKSNKSLIIVEGESDIIFLKGLIKFRNKERFFDVQKFDKGKTLNSSKVQARIARALKRQYKRIFILLDLNTREPNTQNYFSCHPEFREYYSSDILGEYFDNPEIKIIVSVRDLEAWELLAFGDKNTDSMQNTKKKLNKKINDNKKTLIKTDMAKYIVLNHLSKIISNAQYNESFGYFIQQTGV